MKILFTLMTLAAILCVSCNTTNSPTGTIEIWPLKIGNMWVVKNTDYDSLGNITRTKSDTMIVLKDTIVKNEKVFIVQSQSYGHVSNVIVLNRSDGFYLVDIRPDTVYYYLAYKYPAKVGDIYTGLGSNIQIKSINSPITAKPGNFSCYKYFNENQYPNIYFNQTIYVSPGVGLIYSVDSTREKGGKIYMDSKSEIQSYILK
jgi:hypothetical protein